MAFSILYGSDFKYFIIKSCLSCSKSFFLVGIQNSDLPEANTFWTPPLIRRQLPVRKKILKNGLVETVWLDTPTLVATLKVVADSNRIVCWKIVVIDFRKLALEISYFEALHICIYRRKIVLKKKTDNLKCTYYDIMAKRKLLLQFLIVILLYQFSRPTFTINTSDTCTML